MPPRPLPDVKEKKNWREQFGALRNLPPFLALIWRTSRRLTAGNIFLRLLKAFIPAAILYVGKEIIDTIILIADGGAAPRSHHLPLDPGGHRTRLGPLQRPAQSRH